MPASGRNTALPTASFHSANRTSVIRTPSENNNKGTDTSPNILILIINGCQTGIFTRATVKPAMAAATTGIRQSVTKRVVGSSRRAPNEKWSVFSTIKRMTAAGNAFSPQASTANGNPILPELLNNIGGTSVFG